MNRKLSLIIRLCAGWFLLNASAWAQLTLRQAIEKAEHETKGKVLAAETVHIGQQTVYRIKVLTRDGQVRVMQIAADE